MRDISTSINKFSLKVLGEKKESQPLVWNNVKFEEYVSRVSSIMSIFNWRFESKLRPNMRRTDDGACYGLKRFIKKEH